MLFSLSHACVGVFWYFVAVVAFSAVYCLDAWHYCFGNLAFNALGYLNPVGFILMLPFDESSAAVQANAWMIGLIPAAAMAGVFTGVFSTEAVVRRFLSRNTWIPGINVAMAFGLVCFGFLVLSLARDADYQPEWFVRASAATALAALSLIFLIEGGLKVLRIPSVLAEGILLLVVIACLWGWAYGTQ